MHEQRPILGLISINNQHYSIVTTIIAWGVFSNLMHYQKYKDLVTLQQWSKRGSVHGSFSRYGKVFAFGIEISFELSRRNASRMRTGHFDL